MVLTIAPGNLDEVAVYRMGQLAQPLAMVGDTHPTVGPLRSVLFAIFMVVVLAFLAGGAVMIGGPIVGYAGGALVAFLAGLGLVGLSTCIGALTLMACVGLVNLSVWYARLHFRLLKPAIDQA